MAVSTERDQSHEGNLVGCESERADGIQNRDFTNYPQTWSFKIKKGNYGLSCYALGHDVASRGIYEITLRWRDKKWEIITSTGPDEMSPEVTNEMYRQFAAYKARYLAKKQRHKDSPRGVSDNS